MLVEWWWQNQHDAEGVAPMRETVVRDFFENRASGVQLEREAHDFLVRSGTSVTGLPVCDLCLDFEVLPEHLARVCDAVIRGEILSPTLQAIGFFLLASDHFIWDGDTPLGSLVAETVHDWSAPDINYPLTLDNVVRFRERLLGGHDGLTDWQRMT